MMKHKRNKKNPLHIACEYGASIGVVSKLINVGGNELVQERFENGTNLLHIACKKNASVDVVSKLIEVGGKELIIEKDIWRQNSLLIACENNASIGVVSKLIEIGGNELVQERFNNGTNLLHIACVNNASVDVISKLIEVGGKRLVMMKHKRNKKNPLHIACEYGASIDTISKLVEVGRNELVLAKDKNGSNSLHILLDFKPLPPNYTLLQKALLDILTQYGGAKLLTETNAWDNTPLLYCFNIPHVSFDSDEDEDCIYFHSVDYTVPISNTSLLISKGIELQVEGEYGIGGLFSSISSQRAQGVIYKNWYDIVLPALRQVMMKLSHDRHLPILQALVVNKAPTDIIKRTISRFSEFINFADSFGRYPIDIAARHKLAWDDGMKEIVEAFVSTQQTTTFHVCIKHGVPWENGTKEVFGGNNVETVAEREDISTGLYPFMLAAVKESYGYDLDSVFHLIIATPKLVKHFGDNSGEDQYSRKRKRS